ncbi:retrovirus-related pol polyprotein from transposon TNT 1-94 [Tanacetum coccineum]
MESEHYLLNYLDSPTSQHLEYGVLPSSGYDILDLVSVVFGVSRPHLKSNRLEDRVLHNNSEGKKQQVEDHHRNFKFSNNKTTKMLMAMPISTREPTLIVNQSIATPLKRIVASESTNQKPRSKLRKQYDKIKVACRKSTCYIRDLKGNDLLTAWLWHHRLSHLKFDSINLLSNNDIVIGLPKLKFIKDYLCSSCELGKAKRKSFHIKTTSSSKRHLQLLHMDLCGPMRVESINGKKYVLVIVDDYSKYTWTHFLRSKDETPDILIDFLRLIQRGLHAQVRTVRTDKGTEFLNKTLHAYFAQEGIEHQTSTARTPEQNGIVERRNRTLVEVARTMLSVAKVRLVYNKRTRVIVETIHVNFDELPPMALDHVSFDLVIQCPTTALEQDSLSPDPQSQENVPQATETVTTLNELELLFSLMFDELLNGTTTVVLKSSDVTVVDALNQRQKQNITPSTSTTVTANTPLLIIQTTPKTPNQAPTQAPIVTAIENINQEETNIENAQVEEDGFINIFGTPVQDRGKTSSRYVDSLNMHTFYRRHPSEHRWTKDHPLEQVIGNPSQSIRTRL